MTFHTPLSRDIARAVRTALCDHHHRLRMEALEAQKAAAARLKCKEAAEHTERVKAATHAILEVGQGRRDG